MADLWAPVLLAVGGGRFVVFTLFFHGIRRRAVDGPFGDDVFARPLTVEGIGFGLEEVRQCHGDLEGEVGGVTVGVGGGAAGDILEEVHPSWVRGLQSCDLDGHEWRDLRELRCVVAGDAGAAGQVGGSVETVAIAKVLWG